jgi:hypothetical protein
MSIFMQDVFGVLSNLREKKSPGPDDVPNVLLKRCKESLAWPLSILFTKSLQEGFLPQDWRDAIVTPIHKKGNKTKCENYRPVSLTSTVIKVMEKLMCRHIVAHIEHHNLIHSSQYGFRRGLNCDYQLIHYLDAVTKLLDNGSNVDVLYLDMQKAFDKVPHSLLLKKLEAEFRIVGNVKRWLEAYLCCRRQRVRIGNVLSEWSAVTSGVPQGSILGPILFVMYINDIDCELDNVHIYKFADDTKVLSTVNTTEQHTHFQSNIDALQKWADKWKMPFNCGKSAVVHLGKANRKLPYTMNGTTIRASEVERDLGVYIDSKLKFDIHIDKIVVKARKLCGWIRRVFKTQNTLALLKLYINIVRPVLEYASVVWSPSKRTLIRKIEKVQRQFTKRIRSIKHLSYSDRLSALNIEGLDVRRNTTDIRVTRSLLTNNFSHLNTLYRLRKDDCSRSVRGHALSLAHVRCNTAARQQFLTNRVVKVWNSLPESVIKDAVGSQT